MVSFDYLCSSFLIVVPEILDSAVCNVNAEQYKKVVIVCQEIKDKPCGILNVEMDYLCRRNYLFKK